MASRNPPFMNAYNFIPKILDKIKTARTPDRFTQDFLETALGFKGGSARPFIPLAKRIGLLNSDGTPTDLYNGFRNTIESKNAIAQAIKIGYQDIFTANEYAYKLSRKELEGLVTQLTGLSKKTTTLAAICGTFEALKQFADFEKKAPVKKETEIPEAKGEKSSLTISDKDFDLNLTYTINLVLPKTSDINVFNAIFKSIKDNLLKK